MVRLFVSGESWYERTQQVLRLRPGEPEPMVASGHGSHPDPGNHPGHGGHPGGSGHHDPPAFFRIETEASFALSGQGLAEAVDMGPILADRAIALSREPGLEDVLILAHGPGDDGENERWLAFIDARSDSVRASLPFRRVQVETLREDWAEKRKEARARIRAFVTRATDEGGRAIVIPFRVQGFGPYGDVLEGLDYVSDGQGLIPHRNVTGWIEAQIRTLRAGPFESVID